jgi:hypothetical protein
MRCQEKCLPPSSSLFHVPPDPEVINGEPKYEAKAILDSQYFHNRLQFLVSWKDYSYEENTWTDKDDVPILDLVQEFYQRHPGAPHHICAIQFGKLPFHLAHVVTWPRWEWCKGNTHPMLTSKV